MDITVLKRCTSNSLIILIGQVVYSGTCSGTKTTVNISRLPAATYFVKVNSIYTQRIVKE
ncbi:MAG: hypothetical protein H7257_06305 [Taibaiella sp.]|nr:hypothetical protein [Taibaiella sp.]